MRNPDEDYAYELRRQQRIDHENERRDPGRTAELLRLRAKLSALPLSVTTLPPVLKQVGLAQPMSL